MKRKCPICYGIFPVQISCKACNGTGIKKTRYEMAEVPNASIIVDGRKIDAFEALKTAVPTKEDILRTNKPKEEHIRWQFEKLQGDYRTDGKDQKEDYESWLRKEKEKDRQ